MSGYSAAAAAREAAVMLDRGEPLSAIWRHAVVQLLDVYESRQRSAWPCDTRRHA